MRIYKRDSFDDTETPPHPVHTDRLRELVDELPDQQREILSRKFFGTDTDAAIARDLGLSYRTFVAQLAAALETLRPQVLRDDIVGAMLPAHVWEREHALLVASEMVEGSCEGPGPDVRGEGREGSDVPYLGLHDAGRSGRSVERPVQG